MITAIGFMLVNLLSYILAYVRGPFWGLLAYTNIYFNSPQEGLNWWASYLPFDRWSLLTSFVLITSLFVHKKQLASHKYENSKWIFPFFFISAFVAFTNAVDSNDASRFLYIIFTYCLIIFVMLKSITSQQQLRLYFLATLVLAANLSVDAYLYGKRINARLEMVGTADAYGSNEFSLLLAAIIPFVFIFLKNGRKHEKLIALLSMPFILNAFVLCNSRGSTVAFAGGIVCAGIFSANSKIRKGMIGVILVSAPIFLYLTDDEFISRFTTLINASSAMEDESEANELSSGRTDIWKYGIEMAADNPLGVGPNGFKKLARFYMPESMLTFRPGAENGVRSAHNTYLQILVEQGIAGLIVWILLCGHTCIILRRSFKTINRLKSPDPFWVESIFGLNVAFYSIIIGGMVNSRVYFEYFWWLLAVSAIIYSQINKIAEKETSEMQTNSLNS